MLPTKKSSTTLFSGKRPPKPIYPSGYQSSDDESDEQLEFPSPPVSPIKPVSKTPAQPKSGAIYTPSPLTEKIPGTDLPSVLANRRTVLAESSIDDSFYKSDDESFYKSDDELNPSPFKPWSSS